MVLQKLCEAKVKLRGVVLIFFAKSMREKLAKSTFLFYFIFLCTPSNNILM